MHVLNVCYTIDLEAGSGTAERTLQISRHLAMRGLRCSVLTLAIGELPEATPGLEVTALPCLSRRYFLPKITRQVVRTVARLVGEADVVHLMGHWSVLNALVYRHARRYGKPYLFSPAGTLAQAGRSLWLKRLYNALVGRRLVQNARGWIAVTPGEFEAFATYGVPAARVTVLPNGIAPAPEPDAAALRAMHVLAPYLLFVGRLHRVKGPDLLLEAFLAIAGRFPRHRLLFIGPDDGMREPLEETARRSGQGSRVVFLGYRAGAEKDAAYRCAELLVVPSRSEAMSLVALEAGIRGTPALVTDRCGFDELREIDPRLVAPASADGLASRMAALLEDADAPHRVGDRMRVFVQERYSWQRSIDGFVALCERATAR